VAELIRKRGRELIVRPELELYMAEKLGRSPSRIEQRIAKMVQNGVFDENSGKNLLVDAFAWLKQWCL